jgi:hypothetical protein
MSTACDDVAARVRSASHTKDNNMSAEERIARLELCVASLLLEQERLYEKIRENDVSYDVQ